jgi:uncharacterized membrane protein HdeD (DUF308 family)
MLGVMLLATTAIVSAWVATQLWTSPEWPRWLLSFVTLVDVIALATVLVRRAWSRRVVQVLMGIQLIVVDAILIVATAVLVRDNELGAALSLVPLFFGLPLLVNSAMALVIARSINGLAWLDRR